MREYGRLCFPLLILQALLTVGGVAQTVSDTTWVEISGRVVDRQDRSPLPRAQVELPGLRVSVITDEAGRFSFPPLPRGVHRLIVRKLGYRTADGDLTVALSGTFSIELTPEDPDASRVGHITGRVVEQGSGNVLASASAYLEPVSQVRTTDGLGQFDFMNLTPGPYSLRVEALGYATRRDSIAVLDGQTLEVEIRLGVEPIALEGITVAARSRFLESAGFFRRQGKGFNGRQWDAAQIEAARVIFLEDILTTVPGIHAMRELNGQKVIMGRGQCRLKVYVDDVLMEGFDPASLDPNSIQAMEVYHGGFGGVPVEYNMKPGHCGVILLWLKH